MEQKLIGWIEQHLKEHRFADDAPDSDLPPNVVLGVGDDGAILAARNLPQVLVADSIVDQVHFDLNVHDVSDIGHKAIAVNLSDVAAMGAVPESALVSLVLPRSFTFDKAQRLFSGITATADRFGAQVIGGDTCSHDGPLVINVSLTGRIPCDSNSPHGWRMAGARSGDLIVVSGPLGGSILGRHLKFEPRLQLASSLQKRIEIHAATDISDSLSTDLSHIIRKSNVGAELDCMKIPVSDAAHELSISSGETPLQHALHDGEDFELLLTMSESSFATLHDDPGFDNTLKAIGRVVDDHVGSILNAATFEKIVPSGYEHG
ncbi:thiamine-phosphate kinase [Mariniblastus fucicola]|uniref:Thiamine-monophosphate kinase n=1 Tax=Mariniblastus fucicola TaxID=980251 RepID=A0A5B9PDA7_9BACT|nr:thiamine-phosphate kinase [Mariniblastus fucicola]QEG22556.1 Thiamine-monophosphate kinase [Mariniblastus fucicola]